MEVSNIGSVSLDGVCMQSVVQCCQCGKQGGEGRSGADWEYKATTGTPSLTVCVSQGEQRLEQSGQPTDYAGAFTGTDACPEMGNLTRDKTEHNNKYTENTKEHFHFNRCLQQMSLGCGRKTAKPKMVNLMQNEGWQKGTASYVTTIIMNVTPWCVKTRSNMDGLKSQCF